jgi:hypothetical protein
MRHSYRFWLDAVGTPMAVQQKLMRHALITITMNIYGDVVTNEWLRRTRKWSISPSRNSERVSAGFHRPQVVESMAERVGFDFHQNQKPQQ